PSAAKSNWVLPDPTGCDRVQPEFGSNPVQPSQTKLVDVLARLLVRESTYIFVLQYVTNKQLVQPARGKPPVRLNPLPCHGRTRAMERRWLPSVRIALLAAFLA